MMLPGGTAVLSKLWTIMSVVVGVFAAPAFLGWFMFRLGKSTDSGGQPNQASAEQCRVSVLWSPDIHFSSSSCRTASLSGRATA